MATVTLIKKKKPLEASPMSNIDDDEARAPTLAPVSTLKASAPGFKQRQSMHPASAVALNHQQYVNSNKKADYRLCPANLHLQQQQSGYATVRYYPATKPCVYQQPLTCGTNTLPGHYIPAANAAFATRLSPPILLQHAPAYANNAHFGHGYTPGPAVPAPPFANQFDSVQWGISQHWHNYRYAPGGVNIPTNPPDHLVAPASGPVPGPVTVKKTGKSRRRKKNKGKKNGADHVDVEGEKNDVERKGEDIVVEPMAVEHTH
ncbi:hypothetical protein PtrSN002B_003037 [Pyrenophora tritici-repentis]|nr:hypothetical protein PtrSN001C_000435 [Pyrenophora tritici-repentis]KAI1555484.1 hypothetical protein PtrSN002B_003037 [Pyrenophora tritici-repentis]KAI1588538.1 hypothetical protein PtrEW7m1_000553 [Pyrenophora tritici-repentis]KAI1607156.1 hypothetical protein PtrCC142_000715 [Pyrenophora tritici-repentis]